MLHGSFYKQLFLISSMFAFFIINANCESPNFTTDSYGCENNTILKTESKLFENNQNFDSLWFTGCNFKFPALVGTDEFALYSNILIARGGKIISSNNHFECLYVYQFDINQLNWKKYSDLVAPLPINKMSFGNSFELNYPYLILSNYTCTQLDEIHECSYNFNFNKMLSLYKFENESWNIKNTYNIVDKDESLHESEQITILTWKGEWLIYADEKELYIFKIIDEEFIFFQDLITDFVRMTKNMDFIEINDNWLFLGYERFGAYIFKLEDNIWIDKQFIDVENINKGSDVKLSKNNWCAFGVGYNEPGTVYLFHLEGDTWQEFQTLKINSPGIQDGFGENLLFVDDTLYIGDFSNKIYKYTFNGTSWEPDSTLLP